MKVNIIIPVYKAERTLERCLDSLLAQTYTQWKAFLINDASPDNSEAIARRYVERDDRFCYLKNERNLGASATRNRGLAQLENGYVAFLDSDDWWEKNFLEVMLAAVQNHDADMVQCAWRINYPDGSEIPEENVFPEERVFDRKDFAVPLRKMLTGIGMNHMARKLVRCELIRGMEFHRGLKTAEDLEMSFQCMMRAQRLVFVPDALYHYFRSGEGLTGNGLSFRRKLGDNRKVAKIMVKTLSQTELNSPSHRLLARLRPYIIIMDKVMRINRDKKALKRS